MWGKTVLKVRRHQRTNFAPPLRDERATAPAGLAVEKKKRADLKIRHDNGQCDDYSCQIALQGGEAEACSGGGGVTIGGIRGILRLRSIARTEATRAAATIHHSVQEIIARKDASDGREVLRCR
jgi:hypothetical protein